MEAAKQQRFFRKRLSNVVSQTEKIRADYDGFEFVQRVRRL